jgi:predicted MFS family arabinose efflux permease
MNRDYRNTAIVALTALLLVLIVLTYIQSNPWMLLGVAAVLWAIAAIVRAINSTPGAGHSTTQHHEQTAPAKRRRLARRRSRRTR